MAWTAHTYARTRTQAHTSAHNPMSIHCMRSSTHTHTSPHSLQRCPFICRHIRKKHTAMYVRVPFGSVAAESELRGRRNGKPHHSLTYARGGEHFAPTTRSLCSGTCCSINYVRSTYGILTRTRALSHATNQSDPLRITSDTFKACRPSVRARVCASGVSDWPVSE